MHIQIQRQIRSYPDVLWKYLADFSNIYRFHPLLKNSQFIEGSCLEGKGAERQCFMLDGSYIKERIVAWEEGKYYTVEVFETSMPIKTSRATLGVEAIDKCLSNAYLHIDIIPKYKILQPLFYLMFKYMAGPAILRGLDKISLRERRAIAAFSGFTL